MSGRYDAFNKGNKNYKKKIDRNKNVRVKEAINKYELLEPIKLQLLGEDRYSPYENINKRMRYADDTHKKPRCDSCGSLVDERTSPSDEIFKARKDHMESRQPSPENMEVSEFFSKQCEREKDTLGKKVSVKLVHIHDGKEFKPIEILPEREMVEITFTDKIVDVKDIIKLSKKYAVDKTKDYSIDLHKLNNIVPHLEELDSMIGINDIKSNIVSQLMYFLQGFPYTHMLHTVIEGPPGVGKTCLGKILGNIYLDMKCINACKVIVDVEEDSSMNMKKMLSSLLSIKEELPISKFKIVKRSDLIGQHVGSTAIRTQKIINESFGGVLFIDEAYSLAADDAFSKECINTLNQNLSEHGDKFICILAGYPNGLNSLFEMNSGLNRRFPFRYKINKYDPKELYNILKNKMDKDKLKIHESLDLESFIKENYESFPNFGGDIETLLFHIKIMHSKRVFGKLMIYRNIIIKEDVDNAMVIYKSNTKEEERYKSMYQ